jgi:hypothetical protein
VKVRVHATIFGRTFWQLREIVTGGNIGNQNQLDPMFGLGDAAQVDTLRLEWPSGITQDFHGLAANQILTIKEPALLEPISRAGTDSVSWILHGGRNIAYDIEESSDLLHWTPWGSVTNVSGQMTLTDDATNDFRVFRAVEP